MANMGNRQQHSSNSRGNSGGSSNGRGAAAAVAVDSFGFVFGPRQSGPCGSLPLPLPLPLSASACQLKSDRAKKLARNIKAAATTTTTRGSNWQQAATGNRFNVKVSLLGLATSSRQQTEATEAAETPHRAKVVRNIKSASAANNKYQQQWQSPQRGRKKGHCASLCATRA